MYNTHITLYTDLFIFVYIYNIFKINKINFVPCLSTGLQWGSAHPATNPGASVACDVSDWLGGETVKATVQPREINSIRIQSHKWVAVNGGKYHEFTF